MERPVETSLPVHREAIPPERRLPSGKNKVSRIGEQTKGLFDDFTSWLELKVKLIQLDVQEKIQTKVNEAIIKVAPFVAGALAGLFMLVTVALFVGWWLGHPAWGFLVVTVLLFVVTMMLWLRKQRMEKSSTDEEEEAAKPLSSNGRSRSAPALDRTT